MRKMDVGGLWPWGLSCPFAFGSLLEETGFEMLVWSCFLSYTRPLYFRLRPTATLMINGLTSTGLNLIGTSLKTQRTSAKRSQIQLNIWRLFIANKVNKKFPSNVRWKNPFISNFYNFIEMSHLWKLLLIVKKPYLQCIKIVISPNGATSKHPHECFMLHTVSTNLFGLFLSIFCSQSIRHFQLIYCFHF